jgi:hypothetical protein
MLQSIPLVYHKGGNAMVKYPMQARLLPQQEGLSVATAILTAQYIESCQLKALLTWSMILAESFLIHPRLLI